MMMQYREQRTGLEGRRLFDDDAVPETKDWSSPRSSSHHRPGSGLSHTSRSNGTMPDNFTLTLT